MLLRRVLVASVAFCFCSGLLPPTNAQRGDSQVTPQTFDCLSSEYEGGETVAALTAKTTGDVRITKASSPPYAGGLPGETTSTYPDPRLKRLSLNSDLVVLGTVLDRVSHLTCDGTFLFSEYSIRVEDVAKDSTSSEWRGYEITVVAPGGDISVEGRHIFATDSSFEPLPVGARGILFLQRVKGTIIYKASSAGSFDATNPGAVRASKHFILGDKQASAQELWVEVIAAAGPGKGGAQ